MALVLNQRFVGRGLLRSFVLVPWAMAPVSVGVLWSFVYAGNYGALTGLLDDLGLGRFALPWLGDGFRALNLVALTQVWSQAPLTALMLLGRPAVDARQPAPGGHAGWRRRSPLFVDHASLAEAEPFVHDDRRDDQFADGIRHSADHDARGPGRATTVLSWLGYLQAFQFLRFGEGAATLYFLTSLSLVLAIVYFVAFSPRRRQRPSRGRS